MSTLSKFCRYCLMVLGFLVGFSNVVVAQTVKHPNVILIITDDQGYGDLGITGNPHVKTPVIDKLAKESVRFNNFYVSPVCAPTRSSLMTGRYSLRTGIRDTYNGGAVMASSEITIAEVLKQVGYTTGIFGKWHLGDNYPSRPNDQGFDESVIHLSGGMGQVGDFTTYFKKDSSYFNPVLWHNGKQEAYSGYCSDIFGEQAVNFIRKNRQQPFFCYLAFNAPHTPLQVPDEYYQNYKDIDPSAGFKNDKRPFANMSEKNKENARRVYAMVDNIDDNIGKLMRTLDELKIADNTIVVFLSDNGPEHTRYNAGLRDRKGSVYRGGVRVPFYIKYPAGFKGNKDIETPAAHIDILPTLARLCNAEVPRDRVMDGKDLVPLLNNKSVDWAARPLFFYWSRRYPALYHNMALQQGKFKLVAHADRLEAPAGFELFDLEKDPYEQQNIVTSEEKTASLLKTRLDSMCRTLAAEENLLHSPRIVIGDARENPVFLNRNDAGGAYDIWAQQEIFGYWNVHILPGVYDVTFKFIEPVKAKGEVYLETKMIHRMHYDGPDTDTIEMKGISLSETTCDLIPFYQVEGKRILPFWIKMKRILD